MHASKMEMLIEQMGYELIGVANKTNDFLRLFRATLPDVIILDIGLKDGEDGVDIAKKVSAIQPTPTIFATSFEDKETLARALKTDPYAYLVKPVEKPSLQAAIELALYKFVHKGQSVPAVAGQSDADDSDDLIINDSFFVKSGNKLLKVSLEEILWIEVSQDRYCDIVTAKRSYQVRTSMNRLEEKLNKGTFVRIHRSHIVNLKKVEGIDDVDMTVEIGDNSLPLGGTYKDNLFKRFRTL